MDPANVATLIMAAAGLIGSVLAFYKGRNAEKASATKSISEAASILVKDYRDRLLAVECKLDAQEILIDQQQDEIDRLKKENSEFIRGVQSLCNQIKSLGHKPVWEPDWEPWLDR